MDNAKDGFGYDSMAFFGRVNASISHELKNVMAIVSETAGLLGDLADMASSENPISPAMLKDCTDSIMEEIQRGFFVIRQMNRFSHSIDKPAESVNLPDVIDLAINLAGYLRSAGKAILNTREGAAFTVQTCPFLLQAIVYQTLVYAYTNAGSSVQVSISILPQPGAAYRIIFSGFNMSGFQVFPDPAIQSMAAVIGVTINCDRAADQLELDVPPAMEAAGR